MLQVKEVRLASTMLLRERPWRACSRAVRRWVGIVPWGVVLKKAHRYQALQVQLHQKLPVTICSTRCLCLDLLQLYVSRLAHGFSRFTSPNGTETVVNSRLELSRVGWLCQCQRCGGCYGLDHSRQIFLQRRHQNTFSRNGEPPPRSVLWDSSDLSPTSP